MEFSTKFVSAWLKWRRKKKVTDKIIQLNTSVSYHKTVGFKNKFRKPSNVWQFVMLLLKHSKLTDTSCEFHMSETFLWIPFISVNNILCTSYFSDLIQSLVKIHIHNFRQPIVGRVVGVPISWTQENFPARGTDHWRNPASVKK